MVNVKENRGARKWSRRIQVARVLWGLVLPLFMLSPRPLWAWRRLLLRLFRAKIGLDVHIYPSVRVTMPWNLDIGEAAAVGDRVILYALGTIIIGARTTISQGAHICAGTHDIRDPSRPLLMPPITIGKDAWICADAFIGPNVVVGDDAIVGARAVVMKDVPSGAIFAGNPARQIKNRDQ
jgi:putative colanic acid biosynthesis acetyltransferase WcaF